MLFCCGTHSTSSSCASFLWLWNGWACGGKKSYCQVTNAYMINKQTKKVSKSHVSSASCSSFDSGILFSSLENTPTSPYPAPLAPLTCLLVSVGGFLHSRTTALQGQSFYPFLLCLWEKGRDKLFACLLTVRYSPGLSFSACVDFFSGNLEVLKLWWGRTTLATSTHLPGLRGLKSNPWFGWCSHSSPRMREAH